MERSVYVMASALAILAIVFFWSPLGGQLWQVQAGWAKGVLIGVFLLGGGISFTALQLMDGKDLLGWPQWRAYAYQQPYHPPEMHTPRLYQLMRHPLYTGILLMLWGNPSMSWSRFLLALGFTLYIVVGIYWEERDLVRQFGAAYEVYRKKVPMLFPWPFRG